MRERERERDRERELSAQQNMLTNSQAWNCELTKTDTGLK